jgi:hypothetical protein
MRDTLVMKKTIQDDFKDIKQQLRTQEYMPDSRTPSRTLKDYILLGSHDLQGPEKDQIVKLID